MYGFIFEVQNFPPFLKFCYIIETRKKFIIKNRPIMLISLFLNYSASPNTP